MVVRRTLLCALIGLSFPCSIRADDWLQWRGPERTGVSKETGLLSAWPPEGPKRLWTFRDAGLGYSCLAVVGDRLYSMGAKGDKEYVYAIDLNTQKILWATHVGAAKETSDWPGTRSTPTIDGTLLYAIGTNGNLICVETSSGRKVWSQEMKATMGGEPPNFGYIESPLVDGDQVIATPGGPQGVIAAFDKKTGKLKWRNTIGTHRGAYSSMIAITVGGVRQYVQVPSADRRGNMADIVVGVRATDGKLLWEFPFRRIVAPTPIFWDDCIYVSSCVGCKLVKLSRQGDDFKVKPIYANEEMNNHIGTSVLLDGYLYGYSSFTNQGVTCQNFKTGNMVWNEEAGGSGCLTYAEGNLYCYHAKPSGVVLLVKAAPVGYQELGKFQLPERSKQIRGHGGKYDPGTYTVPVVANGKLYLRDHDLIFCYDIHKPH